MNESPHSDATPHPPQGSLTVVGLGASAGGLAALRAFFEAVPPDSGMAYVVITHLDPDRKSEMAELIQNRAAIPVQQATEALPLEPDHAYVIPPNRELRLEGGKLRLAERSERGLHAPIDLFFRTLASACGPRAVGVVLSGTGSDGTSGLGLIKEAGGITVSQDPDDAEYDAMPRSAISAGLVDLVLPASEVPGELLRLQRDGLRPSDDPAAPEGVENGDEDVEAIIRQIVAHLRSRTGQDFSQYKRTTVRRRIERRAALSRVESLAAYLELLRGDRGEAQALLRDLMVSVSSFFRDPEAYEVLEREVIPGLFEGKGADDWVRVWVPGCATGEEAYSVAFLLREHASTLDDPPSIQLFATDIDEHALAFARTGYYPSAIAADVSPERLDRFFTRDEQDGYQVRDDIRKMVLVARHDVLRDPPFSDLDLVTFRNVLIYLQPEAQAHALAVFHYALRSNGAFFLGASESVSAVDGLFAPIDKKHRVFRRIDRDPGLHLPFGRRFGRSPGRETPGKQGPRARQVPGVPRPRVPWISTAADLHLRMLEAYAPPSMVVNREREIVHLSPRAGEYLRVAGGEPSLDVVELAPGELQLELRTALYQALEKGNSTRRSVTLEVAGGTRRVELVVRPLRNSAEGEEGDSGGFALVVFEEHGGSGEEGEESPAGPGAVRGAAELEAELTRTRTELREVVEERQATIEELQAAIEELQSINEEQQATGEELETSREELQSTNEELTTVNEEYRSVIAELNQVNADLRNLIDATGIGTVFLDRELRVRRFTPSITPLINMVDSDRGRPLSDLSHRLRHPGLLEDAATVLRTLETIEREVEGEDGDWYTLRIIPYRSLEDRIDGVVVTFFEITAQKQVESELRAAKLAAEDADIAKSAFVATLSHELRTPLTAILGYTELLLIQNSLGEEECQRIERIRLAANHLTVMLGEILQFGMLEEGGVTARTSAFDARGVAEEAAGMLEPEAAEKGLALRLELPDQAVELASDGEKIRQILLSLLGNAVKFTTEGEIRLSLHTDEGHAVFEVHDTGIGMTPEERERVFERFWQGGNPARGAGTGIGLWVARRLSRLLGGDVTVESEAGTGSTFTLRLPLDIGDG